jgi:hypothetical protein
MKYAHRFIPAFISALSFKLSVPMLAAVALAVTAASHANGQGHGPFRFQLLAPAGAISNRLPNAKADVAVFPREDSRGTDTLQLNASGLLPNIEVTVFLTEQANAPFGAAQYIGDFATNPAGEGSFRTVTIIEEAFSSVPVGGTRVRAELDHVVLWFADPADDDRCFAPNSGPTTPFDGDGVAGAVILSSANLLPSAPLP